MELEELRSALSTSKVKHAKVVASASKYVKLCLVVVCAAIAGGAQFVSWPEGGSPEIAQVIGLAATAGVLIGGIYVLLTEQDAADAIRVAEEALEGAQALQARSEEIDEFFEAFDRLSASYRICLTLRGALEQAGIGSAGDFDDLIRTMLELVDRALPIAVGFQQADQWTIGIYKAVPSAEEGKVQLECIANNRAIPCELNESRVWMEGVGIAGVAYSNQKEIVLPDLGAEGIRSIFAPKTGVRAYDAERYVSMAAVPIMVAGREKPWGVVTATSDQEGHFAAEGRPGFKTDEPIRALAAFVALAVAMNDSEERARSGSATILDAEQKPA